MVPFALIFLTSFLISFSYGTTLYVNSAFLGQFFTPVIMSALFAFSALGNIILFFTAQRLLRTYRKEILLILFVAVSGLGTLGLALGHSATAIGASFLVAGAFSSMGYYLLDICLEELSDNGRTGAIRGLYWTFLNGGIALGPLLVALLAKDDELRPVFIAGALLLLGAAISAIFQSLGPRQAIRHKYRQPLSLPFHAWWAKRNVRAVTFVKVALEFFFTIMTIYAPIYLHKELGFAWSELGIIFTVMLLPFVLLEWPAGEVADHWWGEKEIMSIGLFLIGTMLLFMPFMGKSFAYWLVVLLISRIGAALVEITTESYFFKKISAEDTGLIAIFRLTRPTSFILGTIAGATAWGVLPFQALFFVVAFAIFFAMKESLHLKDTL